MRYKRKVRGVQPHPPTCSKAMCAAQASERGKWTWKDGQRGSDGEWKEKPRLVFIRDPGGPRRRSRRHSLFSITTTTTTTSSSTPAARATARFGDPVPLHTSTKEEEERVVTLEDVKAVAVKHISVALLKRMKRSTAVAFDEFYRTDEINKFLWATLLYFNAFLDHKLASSDENVRVPGSLGEEARRIIKEKQQRLDQTAVNLGKEYSVLVTGQGNRDTHHSRQGSLRVSHTHRDQHLYETIYEFAMYVTWITFGYMFWKDIHKELGRFFKTPAFNRDLKVKGEATEKFIDGVGPMNMRSDEYLSYRVYYDRPPKGSLKDLHSPVLVSYFPSPKEKHAWVFEPPYRPIRQKKFPSPTTESPPEKLGIIGELMSMLNPETLEYKEDSEEEEDEEEEESEEEEEEEEEEEKMEEGKKGGEEEEEEEEEYTESSISDDPGEQ